MLTNLLRCSFGIDGKTSFALSKSPRITRVLYSIKLSSNVYPTTLQDTIKVIFKIEQEQSIPLTSRRRSQIISLLDNDCTNYSNLIVKIKQHRLFPIGIMNHSLKFFVKEINTTLISKIPKQVHGSV